MKGFALGLILKQRQKVTQKWPISSITNFCMTGVEDELNFHGKALGEKGKAAVELMKSSITSDGPHGLGPQPVEDAAPVVDLSVKLSEPPNYKKGEKV